MSGLDSARDFLDVLDIQVIVEPYFAILELPSTEDCIFNFSSGVATSLGDVVRTAASVLGKLTGEVIFADHGNSAHDTSIIVGDPNRLRPVTDWSPHIGIEESLHKLMTEAVGM